MPPTFHGHWTVFAGAKRWGDAWGANGVNRSWLVGFAMRELVKTSVCLGTNKKIKRGRGDFGRCQGTGHSGTAGAQPAPRTAAAGDAELAAAGAGGAGALAAWGRP